MCKPFSPREVVARVKAMFRRARFAAQPAGTHKPLIEIDEAKARISVRGQRLDLTPTEYRLLKLMAGNPGRVYSRAQLLDLCYQQEQQIFDRVIDSHIKNLRKKLAKATDGQEVIHAVYGVGYRFEVEPDS
jgi:two-component system response regulator BaeR